ncbi:hypothetical protein TBC1_111643 [Lentimicrobium saccharophilum]|uniref:Bacterial membrane protein YfhO n=1 Tax=Lentimicrobium saccharophilum TaxID=1678841 RepID=A0A0S7BZ13_9BACT|nr:hypothetical protein [Lentimicrobium saccharophilum]GAP43490.1 hypothetical protein TBC1_111643 [Lentimicrobium saccharophilum]
MMRNRPSTYRVYLVFLAVTALAYWQVALLQNSLKWDVMDCYLPWRYHVGECLQNGIFPFWNPYTHCGYPIHADLRSVWYPEAFVIGLSTGYTNLHLHFLFVFYLSLAGLGMYLLSTHFVRDWRASFMAGCAYLLSGFFTGHGQEMFGIIAATWIPFVLYYYIRLLKYRQFDDVLRTSVFVFLLVTGGYQALWAILFYLLLAVFIVRMIRLLRLRQAREAVQLLKLNVLLLLISVLSLTVIAVSYFQVAPHLGRLSGLSMEDAWFMPFSPRSALSFLIPFATVKDAAWYDTDLSMNNAYAGLIVLVFFVFSLFRKRSSLLNTFLVFGLIALLASFGRYTPVRSMLFHTLPMMDLFRHSSFFSYFALLAIILSAAAGFNSFLKHPHEGRRLLFRISLVTGAGLLILFIYGLMNAGPGPFLFLGKIVSFREWLMQPTRYEHVVIHATIQIFLLSLFAILISKCKRRIYPALMLLIILEMTLAVQLNTYYTVVSAGVRPMDLAANLKQRAPAFPLPQADIPVSEHTDASTSYSVLWRNTTIYSKAVSFGGFNSFRLEGCVSLADSFPQLAEKVLRNPVIFLSDSLKPFSPEIDFAASGNNSILYTEGHVLKTIPGQLQKSADDSIRLTDFYPGFASAEVSLKNPVAITLLQAWYPGWMVLIDGNEAEIFVSDRMFMSVLCGPGNHRVEFVYSNNLIIAAFLVSVIAILLILSRLIAVAFRGRKKLAVAAIAFLWIMPVAVFLIRFNPSEPYSVKKEKAYRDAAQKVAGSGVKHAVFNTDNELLMRKYLGEAGFKGEGYFYNLTRRTDISLMLDYLDSIDKQGVENLARVSLFTPFSFEEACVLSSWDCISEDNLNDFGNVGLLNKGGDRRFYETLNDFEQAVPGWNGHVEALDSLNPFSGRFSNRIDGDSPGSYACRLKFGEGTVPGLPEGRITVLARVRVKGNAEGASLIIQKRRGNLAVETFPLPLAGLTKQTDGWVQVAKAGTFSNDFMPDDELIAYIWGSEKTKLYADDFSLEIISGEFCRK